MAGNDADKNNIDGENDNAPARVAPVEWVDRYGDYLFNYAYSRLHNRSTAEDVVQETFLAALRSRESYAGESSERTWLVGILRHKVIDHLRRVFREQEAAPNQFETEPAPGFHRSGKWTGHWIPSEGPVDWGKNPAQMLEEKEFQEVLATCLGYLSPRLAGVFVLYQMEELTAPEICKELDITPTNLWVMLHRARQHLRLCLERNWISPEQHRKKK